MKIKGLIITGAHKGGTWGLSYRDAATGEMILDSRNSGDVGLRSCRRCFTEHRGAEIWVSGHGSFDFQGEFFVLAPHHININLNN
ncbi:MAG: hypothetical protein ACOC5A_05290 [Halanaerobiales bacterium]